MLTLSRRNGFENRKGIRQTWMNDSVPGEVIRFLIADAGEGEAIDVQQKLEEEQAKHGDLVFLHGFIDIYAHIHLKVYGGFEWQQSFCANAEWVLKVDDDAQGAFATFGALDGEKIPSNCRPKSAGVFWRNLPPINSSSRSKKPMVIN
uniref:Hexosyltransferase n=1 Tax=Globodera pallida TaxID=36090 RepID=A0A183CNL2_GLOPA